MLHDEIAWLGADELTRAYRERRLSPVEVAQATLDRIEALNPQINAYCLVDPESALGDARASEARWKRGEPI
ncbi:MAG TPA: amidase, partial [Burkholderiaceae bacterium]|nr:amidase [Burkholderiaceae bacterium]